MNFYFLLEDSKSFFKVLPLWLNYMSFPCNRVADIKEVEDNSYILQSGHGVTQLVTKVIFDTIDTILLNPNKIDKLVIILDSEELKPEERKEQVKKCINEYCKGKELDLDIFVIVCNHCFETWLLGCFGIYPTNKVDETSYFFKYYNHYNIQLNDPEEMIPPEDSNETIGQYHFHYLHDLLRYKNIRYRKSMIDNVATKEYFEGIVKRIHTTEHLKSFKEFYDFIFNLNK